MNDDQRVWLVKSGDGRIKGPLLRDELALLVESGGFEPAELQVARTEDWQNWRPYSQCGVGGKRKAPSVAPKPDGANERIDAVELARLASRRRTEAKKEARSGCKAKRDPSARESEMVEIARIAHGSPVRDTRSEVFLETHSLVFFLIAVVRNMLIGLLFARVNWILPTWEECLVSACWVGAAITIGQELWLRGIAFPRAAAVGEGSCGAGKRWSGEAE
ncbi:hypothetical protein [Pelagicoccus sp. SDUM812003]|uniref:hypothetical protein n=1 Tax=Pelagicoccus sp. SDUM812003 TaxID=3041267 RepID=UPI00280ED1B4|nr:hypothetical protein [Pelagicoccus sp. SDUM812003]MDQ8202737.1 hypothetical protein [Pelagicoccus sp. SDUM812003]